MEENIIIKRLVSSDGETKKFLFKLVDGQTVESVLNVNTDIQNAFQLKLAAK